MYQIKNELKMLLLSLKVCVACLLVLPCTIKFFPELKSISLKAYLSIIGAGACLSLHLGLWFESLKMTTVASSTVILSLQPIIALVASYIIYKNIVDTRIVFSILISFSGIVVINISDFSMSNSTILIGNGLSFLSAIAMVAYLLLGHKGAKSLTHWLYSFLVFLFSGVFLLLYNICIKIEFLIIVEKSGDYSSY
ncbi:DMT family transporter [Staphylococcus succinus]|uniref:DMT family transporter n=1 Tax=Staphylococcus succinus TaxID=61015 RepID=UPI003F5B72FB